MNLDDHDLVVVDIETTGTNPFVHDALAVALVPINPKMPSFQVFVRHKNLSWSTFARSNFRKFEDQWRSEAVPADEACFEIENYIENTLGRNQITLIGHNVGFDVAFLRKIAFQGSRDQLKNISHRMIDTHTLLSLLAIEGKIPYSARTSDAALDYFKINVDTQKRHTALYDATATRELFIKTLEKLSNENIKFNDENTAGQS